MFEKKKPKKTQYDINWYSDKYQSVIVSRDRLLLVTFLAIIAMGAMTFAMYYFVPLKTVKPFVIQIDEQTGITEIAESKQLKDYSANEALVKYFAMKYIYARESYNYLLFKEDANVVSILSAGDVRNLYFSSINASNPISPLNRYGTVVEKNLYLNSFTFLSQKQGESTVQAKLQVTETSINRFPNVYNIQVTMVVAFNPNYKLTPEQRLINPLGFIVLSYRVDEYKE